MQRYYTSEDLVQNEYRLYDIDLFKSQLKVFQYSTLPKGEKVDNNIKIEDESLTQEEFFPITHEDAKQEQQSFSLHHSFDGLTEENMEIEKKEANIDLQSGLQVIEKINELKMTPIEVENAQPSENLPRKCSNSRFLQNHSEQSRILVQQLQSHSKQRSKYRQTNYFTKKQRSIEVKSIEDLFQKYKTNANTQSAKDEVIRIVTPKSNHAQLIFIPKSPQSVHHSKVEKGRLKESSEQWKEKVQTHQFTKVSKLLTPQLAKYEIEPQKWLVGTQPRIKKVNNSPAKSPVNRYLATEQKNLYNSQLSSSVFRGQVPLKEEYLQQNRLRDEYLKNAKMRSEEINKELDKLKYPAKQVGLSLSRKSSSRKKIFSNNLILQETPRHSISPMQNAKFWQTPKTTKQNTDNKHLYKHIFSSRLEKEGLTPSKRKNNSVDFNYVKQSLVNTRIHIFNSKGSKEKDKPLSKLTPIRKSPQPSKSRSKSKSPRKENIIHNFNVLDMSYETRQWFQKNEKEIIAQSEKIYSYELITRYIGQSQIQVRLGQFIKGMIQPKRWILLMVDGVYARLKDRYLPS